MLIRCENVSYRYPSGTCALAELSLELAPGRCLGIVGANGAGKSSLLLLMAGLREPSTGTVWLEGERGGRGAAARRRFRESTALVLQDPDDQLVAPTVWEDVAFGPANLGLTKDEIRARVEQSLEALGLVELAGRSPHLLSYGQRRRVGLAGALAMRPKALLLDEPSAGLDSRGEALLRTTLRDLVRAHGLALVIATHDLDRLQGLVDDIALLHRGRLLRCDTAAAVLGDEALLRQAELRPPLLVELLGNLMRSGALPHGPLSASLTEVEAILAEALQR